MRKGVKAPWITPRIVPQKPAGYICSAGLNVSVGNFSSSKSVLQIGIRLLSTSSYARGAGRDLDGGMGVIGLVRLQRAGKFRVSGKPIPEKLQSSWRCGLGSRSQEREMHERRNPAARRVNVISCVHVRGSN
jgi:hypothetical protein